MARERVPGYQEFEQRIVQKLTITGKSDSTIQNYSLHLAKIALHYVSIPTDISYADIDDYLYMLQTRKYTPSQTYFKFTVCSLRYAFKLYGLKDKYISLPSIKHNRKLPIVLSKEEVKRMLERTKNIKHKVLVLLLYGCGLRCFEARNVKVSDIDFDRMMLHVRRGKGGRDRYVPISSVLAHDLKKYLKTKIKNEWLFNGKPIGRGGGDFDARYSQRGVGWVISQMVKKADIHKDVTVHTLRHTFATHLLEDGLDIVTIKELLGHSKIETTMVYLHVARCGRGSAFSPLDTLYGIREPEFKHGICPYFVNSVKMQTNSPQIETIKKALSS